MTVLVGSTLLHLSFSLTRMAAPRTAHLLESVTSHKATFASYEGGKHASQRETRRLGVDCLINVTIQAQGKTMIPATY